MSNYLEDAERVALTGDYHAIFACLRRLSFEEFSRLMFSLPRPDYSGVSALLPRMADEAIQKAWTGASGESLLTQTMTFVHSVVRIAGFRKKQPLTATRLLDFGCGYGRILRLMYYFVDSENMWGVDPWTESIDICRKDRILGNLVVSDYLPEVLPVGNEKFDLIYSYSVFTHLSERATKAALRALRRCISEDGICVITIRPKEYWDLSAVQTLVSATGSGASQFSPKADHEKNGFAFVPHQRHDVDGDITYGETSFTLEWLRQNNTGWNVISETEESGDPYQSIVCLTPR